MKAPDIKPKINIAELVDAFRAQEQERLDIHAAEVAKRKAENDTKTQRNAELIEEVRPALEEVASMLPNGRVFVPYRPNEHWPWEWNTNRLEIEWTWKPEYKRTESYTIARIVSVYESEDGLPIYRLEHSQRPVGGYLLTKDDEVPLVAATYNFADIIIPFTRWAGLSKANNW